MPVSLRASVPPCLRAFVPDPRPLYVAFFTRGTLYEAEAARLRASLEALALPYDICGIDPRGDWAANARYTPVHVLEMMDRHPQRPLVQLDADAVVRRRPDLFEDGAIDGDLAAHVRRGTELLNGTLYVAPTPAARAAIERYAQLVAAHGDDPNEQRFLHAAVRELTAAEQGRLRFVNLPAGYCFIPDVMAEDRADGEPAVIVQHQASRERAASMARERRRGWIAEHDSAI